MERRFTPDEFERFLKREADDFKMLPSKKVWHGIYNDIHPGRRWPSITIAFLLISTLIYIGRINTHNGSSSGPTSQANVSSNTEQPTTIANKEQKNSIKFESAHQNNTGIVLTSHQNKLDNNTAPLLTKGTTANTKNETDANVNANPNQNNVIAQTPEGNDFNIIQHNQITTVSNQPAPVSKDVNGNNDQHTMLGNTNEVYNMPSLKGNIITKNQSLNLDELTKELSAGMRQIGFVITDAIVNPNTASENINKKNTLSQQTINNRPKGNYKITWTFFAAPEVTTVSFKGSPIVPPPYLSMPATLMPSGYKVLHHAALGFEAGTQMNYAFTHTLKFTTGLHFTYSGYNIESNEVHPTVATLTLRDPGSNATYQKNYISHYGDGSGFTPANIRNFNLQVSLPIGLQYQLLGTEKVQLNVASDLEPSYVLNSRAYLLSSDGKNYVNDPSLMRKLNMSSNFGLFVSFSSQKFLWQIGPAVRYQWLSTYKRDYTIHEHLMNYGIRVGISPLKK